MTSQTNETLDRAIGLKPKIEAITSDVLGQNIGRGDVVKATWLSLISGRPAFFLGTPGVNKTGTVQALAKRVAGAVFHEELMSVVASADQLLVESTSIEETATPGGGKEIRVKGKLGRAAAAHVFFADEIWKGDSRVLQTVLDLAKGDGVRHEGAMVRTPLMAFLAASNELPDPDGNLAAMWSRMTIRVKVNPLDKGGKTKLVASRLARQKGTGSSGAQLSLADIETLRAARPHVAVPAAIVETVLDIYEQLLKDHGDAFQWAWDDDRRFGRVFDVIQANALLDGRTAVTKQDLKVLAWLLWDTPEQIGTVEAMLAPYSRTATSEAKEFFDALLMAGGTVDKFLKSGGREVDALKQCRETATELKRIRDAAPDGEKAEVARMVTEAEGLAKKVALKAAGVT